MSLTAPLFFIRHGKLDLPYQSHADMPLDVLSKLGTKQLDPSIDTVFANNAIDTFVSKKIPLEKIETIIASPSRRCQDTAALIKNYIEHHYKKSITITTMPELREVHFELNKIVTEPQSLAAINNAVLTAIATGHHAESAITAIERVVDALATIEPEIPTLFITHSFLMQIIKAVIRNNGDHTITISPEQLRATEGNTYLTGFATDHGLQKYVSL